MDEIDLVFDFKFDEFVDKEIERIIRKVRKALLEIEPVDGERVCPFVARSLIIHLLEDFRTYGMSKTDLQLSFIGGVGKLASIDAQLAFFDECKSLLLEISEGEDEFVPPC